MTTSLRIAQAVKLVEQWLDAHPGYKPDPKRVPKGSESWFKKDGLAQDAAISERRVEVCGMPIMIGDSYKAVVHVEYDVMRRGHFVEGEGSPAGFTPNVGPYRAYGNNFLATFRKEDNGHVGVEIQGLGREAIDFDTYPDLQGSARATCYHHRVEPNNMINDLIREGVELGEHALHYMYLKSDISIFFKNALPYLFRTIT